jgi:hypothetical protein
MSGCLPCICSHIPDGGHFLDADADAGSDWACSKHLYFNLCQGNSPVARLAGLMPQPGTWAGSSSRSDLVVAVISQALLIG